MNGMSQEDEDIAAEKNLELFQNQPNPFKNETLISFYLPKVINVTIVIYDISGMELTKYSMIIQKVLMV